MSRWDFVGFTWKISDFFFLFPWTRLSQRLRSTRNLRREAKSRLRKFNVMSTRLCDMQYKYMCVGGISHISLDLITKWFSNLSDNPHALFLSFPGQISNIRKTNCCLIFYVIFGIISLWRFSSLTSSVELFFAFMGKKSRDATRATLAFFLLFFEALVTCMQNRSSRVRYSRENVNKVREGWIFWNWTQLKDKQLVSLENNDELKKS